MNIITSADLAAALNEKVISEAFEIARTDRTGILSSISMGGAIQAFEGYKMSWLDMVVGAAGSALTDGINNSTTTIPVVDGSVFRPGMTLSASTGDEVFLVTAISGNNLTVAARGFGGTTAGALTTGAVLTIDSVGRPENSKAENDGIFQPETVENWFQTMDTTVEFSRRALSTKQFGDTNALAFQVSERLRQLTNQMDRALVRGRKAIGVVDGEDVTYTGGIRYWTDQSGAIKEDAGAAPLTLEMINEINALIVQSGGRANTIAVGIPLARVLNKLVSANYSSQRLANWTADEGSVLALPSDLPLVGQVNRIVVDTNLNDDELAIYDTSSLSIVPMASNNAEDSGAWRTMDATENGQDGYRTRILGDFAVQARNYKRNMARLHNIAIPGAGS
jgi:hypothetical protein